MWQDAEKEPKGNKWLVQNLVSTTENTLNFKNFKVI